MDPEQPPQQPSAPMTIVEAQEKIEEFKQKLIDEHYDELVQEGAAPVTVSFELVEALDVALYYIYAMSEMPANEELE